MFVKMIEIQNKIDCCGCNACADVCTHNAIAFRIDNEGFWYPKVDESKCVSCGLCDSVCPMLNSELGDNYRREPRVVAAYAKNEEIRLDSTSGGLHSTIASKFYAKGGYVGGAIFNDDHSVKHFISDKVEDLERIRSSKYLQSNMTGLYREVRLLLREGKEVFFCGTPCQIQALHNFLRKKYSNLITCDFVCLGVNSPKVFLSYMNMLERRFNSKATKIKFKNKDRGWHNFSLRVDFADGQAYCEDKSHDYYFVGYCKDHLFVRPSCYNCQFRKFPHHSDITLADFWGIEKLDQSMDQDKGTSLLFINTLQGDAVFSTVKDDVRWKEFTIGDVQRVYPGMFKNTPVPDKKRRCVFFEDLNSLPFDKVAKKNFSLSSVEDGFILWLKSFYAKMTNLIKK